MSSRWLLALVPIVCLGAVGGAALVLSHPSPYDRIEPGMTRDELKALMFRPNPVA